MLYLTDVSLEYAIDICLAKPNYSVTIGVLEKTDIIRYFDFLNQNISERRKTKNIPDVFVINRPSVKFDNIQTQNEIIFSNGSRISIILPSASKRCIRCHLLIIDNRIDGDTREILKAFEIRDYDKGKEREERFNRETKGEQLMNIVQVNFINSITQKRYTYKVPSGISLNKGDIIRVRNKDGKEAIAVCVTNSENLSNNAVDMVMDGLDVLSDVVGVYNLVKFQEMANE
jgi:hypothetical protein